VNSFFPLYPLSNLLLAIAILVPAFALARQVVPSNKFESVRNEIRLVEQELEELLSNSKPIQSLHPKGNSFQGGQTRPGEFKPSSVHSNAIRVVGRELSQIEGNLLNLSRDEGKPPPEFSSVPERTVSRDQLLSLRPRGSYFLFINPGITIVNDRAYSDDLLVLQARDGYHFSVAMGRQFGPWTLGIELGHRRFEYESGLISSVANDPLVVEGDSRSNYFSIIGGYDMAISRSWNFRVSLTAGIAKSEESLISFNGISLGLPNQSKSHFQGSAGLALEYAFSQLCAAQLGYRFTYLSEMGSYDALSINQIELGLRWNL